MIFRLIIITLLVIQGDAQISFFTKGQTTHLHLTKGEVLGYNKNITGIQAVFSSPGVFQCSIPGLYAFHFYSLSHTNSKIWLEIYKNSDYTASIYAFTQGDYADAGNSVMLHLEEEDTVYVKAHDNYDNTLFGRVDEIYTTFTGVLIAADSVERITPPVAFSVGLTNHQHFTQGDVINYDKIITNTTGSELNLGKFVVPVDGLYIFHFHSLSQSDKLSWLELYHNDMYVNSAYAHTTNGFADAGNTAILHLHQGDAVYVKSRTSREVDVFGTPNEVYNTFCGALLSPTYHNSQEFSYQSNEEIAFSAGLSRGYSGNQMIFDKIFSNLGNGFNQMNGVFTAPASGAYIFHFHALSQSHYKIWVELFHNYRYIDSLYGHSSTEFAAGSNSAVLELMSGDTVYLKIRDPSARYFGAADEIYCTFSGYYLGPLFDSHPIIG